MQWIYLDNNATTQPAPEVVAAMTEVHEQLWANPSSVHRFGQQVRQRLELARASVAGLIGARPRELIFTSGGTESNNLALRGGLADGDGVLITTPVEHSAIREPAEDLARAGVTIEHLAVDRRGRVDPQAVADALARHAGERTILVSIQWANNETGIIQPIAAIGDVVRQARANEAQRGRIVFHVDATQAIGKLPVDVKAAGIDLATLAAHKFHGPKGVGALWVRTGVRLRPQLRGGPQERERRGGTENTAGIIGMGVAADLAAAFVADTDRIAELRALRDRFEASMRAAVPNVVINSGPTSDAAEPAPADDDRLWNTSNLGFPGLEAEAILLGLSERGVCASAGAACSSGSLEPSPVLRAMGVPEPVAHGSVRFSLSRYTTAEEVDEALRVVPEVVARLGRTLPVGT